MAQGRGASDLPRKGLKQWENDGEGGQRILNYWRRSVKKTWVAAGQRLPGPDSRNSLEWRDLGVGSTDHPSLLSRKHTRGWKQKLHSYCLGKKSPDIWVLVLDAHPPAHAPWGAHAQANTRLSNFYSTSRRVRNLAIGFFQRILVNSFLKSLFSLNHFFLN